MYFVLNLLYLLYLKMDNEPRVIGSKLVLNGYVYLRSKNDLRAGKTYWDCNRLRRKECNARAITSYGDEVPVIFKEPTNHSHAPNREETEAEVVKCRLKRTAEEHPELPPAQILRTELPSTSAGVLSQLPERENLKKAMRRQRRQNLPPNPKSLAELSDLPERFQKTLIGEKFLIYDSRDSEDDDNDSRVLVFATRKNLELLSKSEVWFLDGTFKVLLYLPKTYLLTKLIQIFNRFVQLSSRKFSPFWVFVRIRKMTLLSLSYMLFCHQKINTNMKWSCGQ